MVPIDPKLREQCHGEIDHLCGLRDNDGLALEASEPMPLPTVIAFDDMGRGFTLRQLILWDNRGIGHPFICAIELYVPLCQTLDHLLQRLLVSPSAFPVQQLPGIPIEGFPDPEFVPFFLI